MSKLFLGRTFDDEFPGNYELGTLRKGWNNDTGFADGGYLICMCASEFEKYSDLRLKPGEVVRVANIKFQLA